MLAEVCNSVCDLGGMACHLTLLRRRVPTRAAGRLDGHVSPPLAYPSRRRCRVVSVSGLGAAVASLNPEILNAEFLSESASGLTENCIKDANRIRVLGRA